MKKIICLFSLAGLFTLGSCNNSNRGVQNSGDADHVMEERDTSSIHGQFNERGVPAEGIPDNNALRGDSINIDSDVDNSEVMRDLPSSVYDKVMEDESLRKKKLVNSRKYSEGGNTYYELTFENGDKSSVTFDEKGMRKNP